MLIAGILESLAAGLSVPEPSEAVCVVECADLAEAGVDIWCRPGVDIIDLQVVVLGLVNPRTEAPSELMMEGISEAVLWREYLRLDLSVPLRLVPERDVIRPPGSEVRGLDLGGGGGFHLPIILLTVPM